MDVIKRAFTELFPEREFPYATKLTFSGRFTAYNASVMKRHSFIEIRASRAWKGVADDIMLGLVQTLLVKLFGHVKDETYNMRLYDQFLKNIHISIQKKEPDKMLAESFNRVACEFFSNTVEMPNLRWGSCSKRKLGSYDFQTDTIVISRILLGKDLRLIDYVVFHEILHKKLKFSKTNGRKHFHTAEFRGWEKRFPQNEEIEEELKRIGRNKKTLLSWLGERFK